MKKLIQLAARGLISDDEFKESRAELDKIINGMKEQLKETSSDKNKDLMDLTEKAFVFSTYAFIVLKNGDKITKKEIIKGLGMNRTVRDKKLFIEANDWYEEIRKGYFSLKEFFAGTEPEICLKQRTIDDFPALRSILRGRPDLNRQPSP